MAERNEWAVHKTLDVIELTLDCVGRYPSQLQVVGRARAKRDRLWTHVESFPKAKAVARACSAVEHVMSRALLERPVTQAELEAALAGRWHQEDLGLS